MTKYHILHLPVAPHRKWGRGEILQDHSLLLLLPPRDNNLKEAKTLSDLFYHPNEDFQQAVVQEVTSNQGQGVTYSDRESGLLNLLRYLSCGQKPTPKHGQAESSLSGHVY